MTNFSNGKQSKKIAGIFSAAGIASILLVLGLGVNPLQIASASAPGPEWLEVISGSVQALSFGNVQYSITTDGGIPHTPNNFINSNIATGFAWADTTTGKAFVVVIHPTFKDSNQRPLGWHAHIVSLEGGATAPHDFCVKSVDSAPITAIHLLGNQIKVLADQLPPGETASTLNAVAGFTMQNDNACASKLAVQISS